MYKCYVCTCGFVIHPKMDAFFHHRSRRSCRFFLINRKVGKTAPPLFNRRKFVENWREEGKRDRFGSDLVAKLVALIKIYRRGRFVLYLRIWKNYYYNQRNVFEIFKIISNINRTDKSIFDYLSNTKKEISILISVSIILKKMIFFFYISIIAL